MFITFEGIDGSGKSTQVELLKAFLESEGRLVEVAREPGGTPVGECIRQLLLDGEDLAPWTEASLFAAARAELVERVVKPALAAGRDVVLDRFLDSSLAYQSIGRGLGLEPVRAWNLCVVDGTVPDLTFLLVFPAEDVGLRVGTDLRLFAVDGESGPPDRMERESIEFRRTVEEAYRQLARDDPQRIVEVDATKPVEVIATEIRDRIARLLGDSAPAHALSA